jgi:SAM-dependent methyltransferase
MASRKTKTESKTETFDAAYYERYYERVRTRVASPEDTLRLARFVAAYLVHLRVGEVRSVLDLGCGLGWWKEPSLELFHTAKYRGVEFSDHLVKKLGWEKGSVADYAGPAADLVVCQGVLHYLDRKTAERAMENLARLTKKALYVEALTKEDWAETVDKERTDGHMQLRVARFYRSALNEHFEPCGGGVYVPKAKPVVLFALERGQ